MATFSIQIPDDQLPLIGEAFTSHFLDWIEPEGYDQWTDEQKVAAQTEFARQKVIQTINDTVRTYQHRMAQRAAIEALPENPITIT